MVVALIIVSILTGVSGLLLKLACWLHNYWFTDSQLIPDHNAKSSPVIPTAQTAEDYVASKIDQTNPYSPPLQTAKPATITKAAILKKGPPVFVPSFAVAIGFAFFLLVLQFAFFLFAFSPREVMLRPLESLGIGIRVGLALIMTFAATVGFVKGLLVSKFTRAMIVTGIYYGLLLALASPLIVLFVFFWHVAARPI